MRFRWFLTICICGLFYSCSTNNDGSTSESEFNRDFDDIKSSNFCLPIRLSFNDLEAKLNGELKNVLVSKRKVDKNTKITIVRNGKVRLSGVSDKVQTTIPLKVEIRKKKIIDLPVISFQIDVSVLSELKVNSDWSVSSSSYVSEYSWKEEPTMTFLGLDINLKDQVEKVLNEEKRAISKSFDALVSKKISLEKVATKTWNSIQRDHNLLKGSGDTLILKVLPLSVGYLSHSTSSDAVTINVKVEADLKICSFHAIPITELRALPKLLLEKDTCDGIKVNLPSIITFKDLNASLNKHLSNSEKPIELLGYSVKSVRLSQQDRSAYITLNVEGVDDAILGAEMRLEIDSINGRLMPEISEIEVLSGNLQTSIAIEILNLYVSDILLKYQGFDYSGYLQQLPQIVEQAIENGKSGDMWHPEFQYMNTIIDGFMIDQSSIQMKFKCKGSAVVVVDSIKPKLKE